MFPSTFEVVELIWEEIRATAGLSILSKAALAVYSRQETPRQTWDTPEG